MRRTLSRTVIALILTLLVAQVVSVLTVSVNASSPPSMEVMGHYGISGYDTARGLVQTSDGGLAMAGATSGGFEGTYDFYLVKTNIAGGLQWQFSLGDRTEGLGINEWGEALVQTSDGGFVLVGSRSASVYYEDAWVVKTTASGSLDWEYTYDGVGIVKYDALCVIQTDDGGFAVAGWETMADGQGAWFAKIKPDGSPDWSKRYVKSGNDDFQSLVQTGDGGFALAGHNENGIWLVKTNSEGVLQRETTYGNPGDQATSVVQTSDGGFVLAGLSEDGALIVKTDNYGVEEWIHHYDLGAGLEAASCVVQTIDGGFAFTGSTDITSGGYAWLLKTDMLGIEEWSQTYSEPYSTQNQGFHLVQTSDRGFALAGLTVLSGVYLESDTDAFLVKTAPEPGLWIQCTVDDPSLIKEDWSYLITYPDGHTESFALPAGGGITLLPITQNGLYSIAQTRKSNYNTSTTVDGIYVPATAVDNKVSLTTSYLDDSDTVSVVFSNVLVPDAAWAKPAGGGDSSPPSMSTYNIPCRVAVPVQVSWDPDIEPNEELDLVKDKPIKIFVNLADVLYPTGPLYPDNTVDSVTVSVTCEPAGFFNTPLTATRTGVQINSNSVVIFSIDPPSTVGHYTITCTITHGVDTLSQTFTDVKVRETSPLALYCSHLYRGSDYGTEPAAAFGTMLTNTRDFVKAVYPVSGLTFDSNTSGIPGEAVQANYIGMLKDCQRIEQQAKLRFPDSPNAIGVAIGPDLGGTGYKNYFAYHGAVSGKKTAVGVSFGPAVKGVVVLDGYYSAVPHEIGHTFGLYYGVPEQYTQYNPGAPANGFWVEQNQWRSGYDFMGLSSHESTTSTWVSTETTFEPLFSGLKTSDDPQIILVNGIIYKDASGVTSAQVGRWYSMPSGTPDTIPTGEVSRFVLRFYLDEETYVETGFDAQFFLNVDPGIEAGEDLPLDIISGDVPIFGTIPVNFAGFAFATEYPQGTVRIELVDTVQDQVIATVDPKDVVSALSAGFGGFLPPINNDGSSSFKKGTAVPVKFQLKDPQGAFITTAQARLFLRFGTEPEIEAISIPASTSGNLFRYDFKKNQYIFNLDTRRMQTGIWELRVELGDGTLASVKIRLR